MSLSFTELLLVGLILQYQLIFHSNKFIYMYLYTSRIGLLSKMEIFAVNRNSLCQVTKNTKFFEIFNRHKNLSNLDDFT